MKRSLLSDRCYLSEGSTIEESILLSGVSVGAGCRIRRAIVDKWNQIPADTVIGFDAEQDAERFTVTETGIVVVPRGYWS